MYLPDKKIRKYDLLRALTLSKLRTALATNKVTAGAYNSIKSAIYKLKGTGNGKKDQKSRQNNRTGCVLSR